MKLRIKEDHSHEWVQRFFRNPTRVIVISFAFIILLGSFLLMTSAASRSGVRTPFFDAFFTATSATCVTGLIVVDTYTYFSLFGQIVILCLIQLGGLGLVTLTTFFNLAIRKRLALKTMQLAQESVNADHLNDVSRLIKTVVAVTFGFELAGAVSLATVMVPEYGAEGIFISVFLAISSYCNAGFDILGRISPYCSLMPYYDNPVVLITVMLLILCGGLGFIVWHDLFGYRQTKRLTLHSKIVLIGTALLTVVGGLGFLLLEWNNPNTLGTMSVLEKIGNSFFYSVSCRTAGYNTFDLGSLNGVSKLLSVMLMFIGAAPGSTGGGVKLTTFMVLWMTVFCTLRGKSETIISGRRIEKNVVYKSLAVLAIGLMGVLVSTCIISFSIHTKGVQVNDIDALFESTSAFATVGLSVGVTGIANTASRLFLIFVMFMGRVGPVSLALSLSMRDSHEKHQVLPEGKILVG